MNGINHLQMRAHVIEPVLYSLGMFSQAAVELLILTVAHESHGGHYLVQRGGPAVGIFQIEPSTASDIIHRYLKRRDDIEFRFEKSFQLVNTQDIDWSTVDLGLIRLKLITDLRFSTAVARLKYWMAPEKLPAATDIQGLAKYYKRFYNSADGKANIEQVRADYERYTAIS